MSKNKEILIQVKDLYFKYKKDRDYILKGVNLKIVRGEVIGLVGLSGGGKTSLLYSLCGIIPHIYKGQLKGQVILRGKDISQMKLAEVSQQIGLVFQDPDTQLFSPRVEDEIAFGPENLCIDPEEIGIRIDKVLKTVNMEAYRHANPNNLSGGQKQLIAIASILAMETDILLFDEIVSQVDKKGKENIQKVINNLKSQGSTIVLVDHDLNNLKAADRILELKDGKLIPFKGCE